MGKKIDHPALLVLWLIYFILLLISLAIIIRKISIKLFSKKKKEECDWGMLLFNLAKYVFGFVLFVVTFGLAYMKLNI